MRLVITLLYILIAYLSPAAVFGTWSEYHLELIVAFIALLMTIFAFPRGLFKQPQILAILGMLVAVGISLLLTGWLGSAPRGIWAFLPNVFVYILIVVHCRTKGHLQWIIAALFFVSCYTIARGAIALYNYQLDSPFLLNQGIGEGEHLLRIRGLSLIGDPNDFAQVLVSLIPCLFFFWIPKRLVRNLVIVAPAVAALLYGIYLTHSRGAIIALTAIVVLATYRRFGAVVAGPIGAAAFLLAMYLGLSGGRQISVEAGSDRMDAWYTGLELLKHHPLFGVGYLRFPEYYPITAHNSVVVCAAELGLVGFYFWVLLLFVSIRNGVVLSRMKVPDEAVRIGEETRSFPYATRYLSARKSDHGGGIALKEAPVTTAAATLTPPNSGSFTQSEPQLPPSEIKRLAMLMVICLTGYLAAGWFLSRAYVMWLFIFCGMMQVLVQIAEGQGLPFQPMKLATLLKWSLYASVALLLAVVLILQARNLVAH